MLKRLFASQLRVNVLAGVASTAVMAVVMAVSYPLYLHFLGRENYGTWLLLASVVGMLQLSSLGMTPALVKLVAEASGRDDHEAAQGYIDTSMVSMAALGGLVVSIFTLASEPIVAAFDLGPQTEEAAVSLVPIMGVLTVYSMLVQSATGVLSGLGRIDLAHIAQSVGRAATVVVSGVLLWRDLGLEAMVVGVAAGAVSTHVLCVVFARRLSRLKIGTSFRAFSLVRLKELLSFGTAVLGTSLVAMLFDPLNKMLLARFDSVAGIPIYDIGFRAAMFVRSLFEVGLRAIMPEISRIGAILTEDNLRRIRQLVNKALKIIFTFGLGVYVLVEALAEPLLRLWLRSQYDGELLLVFRVMLFGSFVSLIGVPAYHTLMARGRAYRCLVATAIPALTNVIIVVSLLLASIGNLSAAWLAVSMVIGSLGATVYLNWEYQNARTWR